MSVWLYHVIMYKVYKLYYHADKPPFAYNGAVCRRYANRCWSYACQWPLCADARTHRRALLLLVERLMPLLNKPHLATDMLCDSLDAGEFEIRWHSDGILWGQSCNSAFDSVQRGFSKICYWFKNSFLNLNINKITFLTGWNNSCTNVDSIGIYNIFRNSYWQYLHLNEHITYFVSRVRL